MKEVGTRQPSFETADLRANLKKFFDQKFCGGKLGSFKWGAYAFYDYDGEPIYVGQTKERLGGRVGRHLTNQRTDAVAMSVLDPLEVFEIEVWPLPHLQVVASKSAKYQEAISDLNALEYAVFQDALARSKFHAILNEKDPPKPKRPYKLPASTRGRIVSANVEKIRAHPDVRIARRAATLARLAQVISERQPGPGLRRTLVTQAKRLQWLASERLSKVPQHEPKKEKKSAEV